MFRQLSLAGRGRVIVLVPLLCQLVSIACLVYLLAQTQQLAVEQSRSRELMTENYMLMKKIGDAALFAMIVHKSGGFIGPDQLVKKIAAVSLQELKLEELTKDMPRQRENMKQLTKLSQDVCELLRATATSGERAGGRLEKMALHQMMEYDRFSQALIAEERLRLDKLSPQLERTRFQIRVLLCVALAAGVFLAFGMAAMYARGIRQPLEQLEENTRRLSRREELPEEMMGSDEIAQLDRVVHEVDAEITRAMKEEADLFENAGDMILSAGASGEITKANRYAQALLGGESDRVVGSELIKHINPSDRQKFRTLMDSCRSSDVLHFESGWICSSNQIRAGLWSMLWSELETCYFVVAHDVTERNNVERLKEDFLAMISHDLRSPLMIVQGSVSLLLSGGRGQLPSGIVTELQSCQSNIERLIALINDLLDFEKLQAGKMSFDLETCNLYKILQDAVQMLNPVAKARNISLNLPDQANETVFEVNADSGKMLQVVLNLVANAIKFTPDDLPVTLECRKLVDGAVQVEVKDSGPGIPHDYLDKVFLPFEQVPGVQASSGTGLGLAICRSIIDGHGGTTGVSLNPEGGSTFWFRLG